MESKQTELPALPCDASTSVQQRTDRRVLDSQSLFAGAREIRISHNGESYLLRMTRLGKLILTK